MRSWMNSRPWTQVLTMTRQIPVKGQMGVGKIMMLLQMFVPEKVRKLPPKASVRQVERKHWTTSPYSPRMAPRRRPSAVEMILTRAPPLVKNTTRPGKAENVAEEEIVSSGESLLLTQPHRNSPHKEPIARAALSVALSVGRSFKRLLRRRPSAVEMILTQPHRNSPHAEPMARALSVGRSFKRLRTRKKAANTGPN